jgi:hypothetical protein
MSMTAYNKLCNKSNIARLGEKCVRFQCQDQPPCGRRKTHLTLREAVATFFLSSSPEIDVETIIKTWYPMVIKFRGKKPGLAFK